MPEVILPGVYVTVKDEGLISAGAVSSGNIGIVGTASEGPINEIVILGSFSEAKEIFGEADAWQGGDKDELTLIRALELIFNNGGKTVYAVRTQMSAKSGKAASQTDYQNALAVLENEIVNIVVLAGQDESRSSILDAHLKMTAGIKRERIGIIGASVDDVGKVADHELASDRIIYVAPGICATVVDPETREETQIKLPAGYTAAAVAGLISSIPVQTSPTNKVLTIGGLSTEYNSSKLEKLVQSRVLAVEKREGYRIVKGITTATNSAWHQITTRRIVDYAIYGVRSGCNPYIGKLNNERVRSAMKATLDAFLTRMTNDEALVGYSLDVTATRAQQIAGEVQVTMTLQPTFSIDFIKVTMYLS